MPTAWAPAETQLLQDALRAYPPSMPKAERWNAIAAAVPGRSSAECLEQCRALAAAVRATTPADALERMRRGKAKEAERKEAEAKAAAAKPAKAARWWTRELAGECDPISLEPLRSLRYPPFECKADPTLSHGTGSDWFDGVTLAAYLVSTGQFFHPISRRELVREDCASLDEYLVEHGHGEALSLIHI